MGGLHPVVAIYATFLNRAFDQVLMDCALHRCGVTFVLDRAGVTGDDGASHNGMWDMSILQVVPGLRLAAPRDATRLRELLNEAVDVDDAPTVLRFPKGPPPEDIPAVGKAGGVDVLVRNGATDVLVVGVGAMATIAVDVAERLVAQGIGVTVVDPRWVKPVDPAIVDLARQHRLVVSIEDNGETGGCGAVLLQTLNAAGVTTPFRLHAIPQEFLGARQAGPDPRADRARPRRRSPSASSRTSPPSPTAGRPGRCRPPGLGRTPSGRWSAPGPAAGDWPAARCPTTTRTDRAPAPAMPPPRTDRLTDLPPAGRAGRAARALDRRSAAVRDGDARAFLAGLAPGDRALRRQQRTYFANLAQLPLGDLRLRARPDRHGPRRRRLLGRRGPAHSS